MLRFVLLILLPIFYSLNASAQKVKYKDLIVLLNAKQYEKAEPFLKRYLKDNDDNPNAFLYMGIIFQEKSLQMDPLLQTKDLCATIDSSALFYDKAFKTITDRELRKNDEYYEAYMRRDLRTGKFVIKLSDLQLDIENRMKSLGLRKERVKKLKAYFNEASEAYTKANSQYKSLLAFYGKEREFFLRSNEEMVEKLKSLISVFDSSVNAFDSYKSISKELGKTGYNQLIDLQTIKDIKRDGSSPADFMKEDLLLWNYKEWALRTINVIEKEIFPMWENLVAYDIEINKAREKLKKDSVSVKSDLNHLKEFSSVSLKKYDPDPMPFSIFAMKIAELEYHSNVIQNKIFRDSADVWLRLNAIKSEIVDLKKIDSIATKLSRLDYPEEDKDYHHFITKAYGTPLVLKSTVNATQDYAKRELLKRETEWETESQSLKWLTSESDSIPLFYESNVDLEYKPLFIEQEKYTFGLNYKDSLATGYFFTITPSRIPDVKVSFPVEQVSFSKRLFPLAKGMSTSDELGNIFILLIYSTQKTNEHFPVTLVKIYRSDGLSWTKNFSFEHIPSGLKFDTETGSISIKSSGADGAEQIMAVDKTGKIKN